MTPIPPALRAGHGTTKTETRLIHAGSIVTATALALAVAAAASATEPIGFDPDLDEKILVPSFGLGQGDGFTFTIDLEENGNAVVGFSFSGIVSGIGDSLTWASDTQLTIGAPNGDVVRIGGFTPDPPSDLDWDFQGPGSTLDGFYASGPHLEDVDGFLLFGEGAPKGGVWTFTFTQTLADVDQIVEWSEVSVVLHKVPAPGAMALLGLAGLTGRRRRRD